MTISPPLGAAQGTLVDPEPVSDPAAEAGAAASAAGRGLIENVQRVIRGQDRAVGLVATAILAGGHVLIEDLPGSGKTTMARAFARSIGADFRRIQATADLLPSDITGSSIWDPDQHRFSFIPGPVFANVVLVDELNRTPARTQSAFLEAMEEHAVTVDGVRYALPEPFVVIATQNPTEQHGAYPLPEGQLDRFAVRIQMVPLAHDQERAVMRDQLVRATVDDLNPVIAAESLNALRRQVRSVHVADPALDHALHLVAATRTDPRIRSGASSRAAITLVRCAQARALLNGRSYVLPDDINDLAEPVLAHRLTMNEVHGQDGDRSAVVAEIVRRTAVPLTS